MDLTIKSESAYNQHYQMGLEDPEKYWGEIAQDFNWKKPWSEIKSGSLKEANLRWFDGAELNITENCLDRHLEQRGDKVALLYEPNDPSQPTVKYTYRELHQAVNKTANMFKELGVQKGDRVCLYMGMVPELMFSVLACARVGAIHSVVFGGFSASSLAGRIQDCEATHLITNDGSFRGAKTIPLKSVADEALKTCPTIKKMLVHKRTEDKVQMQEGRDHWWHDLFDKQSDHYTAETMQAEDPLFILYTSGSTGKPKGLMHTCAGYMVYAAHTYRNVFQVGENDTYWCTADIGWITGHTYITYGPLLNGSTTVMFEGVPTWPDAGRFWQIVDKHKITHFYTAPTAIRALEACEAKFVEDADLGSLKVLGTVGEPINAEAWHWYDEKIGKKKCPIVDTWWQTETGGIMISPIPHVTKMKPTFATSPLPGIVPTLMDENGKEIAGNGVSGNLCIKNPWPGMARSIWGDHKRYVETYLSTYPGYYFTGDGCLRDEEGHYRITGRVDDVINVSGHRLGTAEIENAINQHPDIVESAVVGYPHDIKGQGIYAYVILQNTQANQKEMVDRVKGIVNEIIGPIARPDKIQIVPGLPKTRSGKIMRRILRKVAEGDPSNLGDTSTLLDPTVVEQIIEGAKTL